MRHVWGTFSHDVNFGINISEPGWSLFNLTVQSKYLHAQPCRRRLSRQDSEVFHSYRRGYAEAQRIVFSPELNSNSEVH